MKKFLILCLLLLLVACSMVAQSLRWEDQFNLSGKDDRAMAARIIGDKAVVVGAGGTAAEGVDLLIRSYDLQTGTLAWQDSAPLAAQLTTVVGDTADGTAFIAGYAANGVGSDILVRAYNAVGNKLWEDIVDKGRDDVPQAVAAGPAGVYAVGYGGNIGDGPLDGIVRAYDKSTGALLWEDQFNNGGDDAAWKVVVTEVGTVVVAGSSRPSITDPWTMLLRGYNATTGVLIWQSVYPLAFPQALAVGNGKLYVAGEGFIASYTELGTPVWTTAISDTITDLVVIGPRVAAVGNNLTVYGIVGNVVWGIPSDGGKRVILANGVLFVAGSLQDSPDSSQFAVRAYAPGSGALLWTDLSHPSFDSTAFGLAACDNVLLAVGWVTTSAGDNDFLVRAYSLPKHKSLRDKIRSSMLSRLQYSRP